MPPYTPRFTLGGLTVNPAATITTVTGASFTFGWNNTQSQTTVCQPTGASTLSLSSSQPLLAGGGAALARWAFA